MRGFRCYAPCILDVFLLAVLSVDSVKHCIFFVSPKFTIVNSIGSALTVNVGTAKLTDDTPGL